MDFDNTKASFNKGFTLSVWSRARYKSDWVIMKCSMGNLPSSALTPIFEDVENQLADVIALVII
jgi:hypothetical protein